MKHIMKINNSCEDWEWEYSKERLAEVLNKTRIKTGFLSSNNLGWRHQTGYTEPFELNVDNFINKVGIDGQWNLSIIKEGHKLHIIRYSHDEPTGATILLHSTKHYKQITGDE